MGVGPFEIHAYGLMYAVAVVAAVLVCRRRWAARGGSSELVDEVALWGFPAGLDRRPPVPRDHELERGPAHLVGAVRGLEGRARDLGRDRARRRRGDLARAPRAARTCPRFLDAAAPALLVAQSIGRVGNWFNQELFGKPTTLPWGLEIDPRAPPGRLPRRRDLPPHVPVRDPLEPLARRASSSGSATGGGSGRRACSRSTSPATRRSAIFAELIRVDPAHHFLGLRLNLFVAVTLTVLGLAWFARTQRARQPA